MALVLKNVIRQFAHPSAGLPKGRDLSPVVRKGFLNVRNEKFSNVRTEDAFVIRQN